MSRSLHALPLLALAACAGRLDDPHHATGTHVAVALADQSALYTVNPAVGSVSRLDLATDRVDELALGGEPTRVALAGDRLLVTLRGERALAVIADGEAGPELIETLHLGAEPFGVVASQDGARVYVSLSQEHRVVELDGASLEVLRSFDVPDEPRWMALSPRGHDLIVASAFNARLSWIDLQEGLVTRLELPEVVSTAPDSEALVELTPRLTGDPAISPDGGTLIVPMLWVDNLSPVDAPDAEQPVSAYGSMSGGRLGKFNAAALVVPMRRSGPDMDGAELTFVMGSVDLGEEFPFVRGYPSAARFAPAGDMFVLAFEGSRALATVSLREVPADDRGFGGDVDIMFDTGGELARGPESEIDERFTARGVTFTGTRGMPQGLVFLDHGQSARVVSGLTHSIEPFDFLRARAAARISLEHGFTSTDFFEGEVEALASTSLELPEGVQEGRLRFFSAVDPQMSSGGAGVSCGTCHFDGRTDGLSWNLESLPRQTPSLAGRVSETAPVTWFDEVPTVTDEAMITSQQRMGGSDLGRAQAHEIAAFIDWTPEVDHKDRGARTEAVARGREIFERADVACASCHPAPTYTDGLKHDMYAVEGVSTPSLLGVAATAPYLHGGQARTLRQVLESARGGEMGDTGALSEAELADLEAFLRSL